MPAPPGPFSITTHSPDDIGILAIDSDLSKTIVDWGAAASFRRLSDAIVNPPPPYEPSDAMFDAIGPLLPEHGMIEATDAAGFGVLELHFVPLDYTGGVAETVNKLRQLVRELVDVSTVVTWFHAGRVFANPPSITQVAGGISILGTVQDIASNVDRGDAHSAWTRVGQVLSDGGNTLAQFSEHESTRQDPEVLRTLRAALVYMRWEIDMTLDGLKQVGPGLEVVQRYVNKVSGTMKSCCPKIVSLSADLASATLPFGQSVYCTPQQWRFTLDWGKKIADCWTGDNLDQLDVCTIGWTRIGANLISALSTGSNIRDKLDNAITAIDARLLEPSAPTTNDALDHLCVVLKQFMGEVETWARHIDEILVINRQYLADGSDKDPLSRLLKGRFVPVVLSHPQIDMPDFEPV